MELPKYHETFIPNLEILRNGDKIQYKELARLVRDKFYTNLPEELLEQKISTGENLLLDRISWGKCYLKQAGFVHYPERGLVQITEKGKAALKKGVLTLSELKSEPEYVAHEKEKEAKKKAAENSQVELNFTNNTPQDFIDKGFYEIAAGVKSELLEKLKKINPYDFENVILVLLKKMGYGEFESTPKSGDGGIDGIINQDQLGIEKIYIQAKRYSENKVREGEIRNFIGAMSGDTNKGVFVTTSNFDSSAIKKAEDAHHKIILIDGKKLVSLMYQFGVGVQVKNIYEVKEIDIDFFEQN